MYCRNCGARIDDKAVVCVKCGADQAPVRTKAKDDGSFIWTVVGFLAPVAALVLYLVWKDEKPLCAKRAALGGVISLGFGIGTFLFTVLMQVGITVFTLLFSVIAGA